MLNDNIHHMAIDQLMKSCKKAADEWADKTKIGELIDRLSATDEDRAVLLMFAKQCFTEGVMQGSMRAMSGMMSVKRNPKP